MIGWSIKQKREAIEYLSEEIAKEKGGYSIRLQSFNIAIEAIEKSIPKITTTLSLGDKESSLRICPICGNWYGKSKIWDNASSYCEKCGQLLKEV